MSEAEQGTMAAETIERVALLREATALEQAGGTWNVRHVCAVLDCHRATLYRSRWLMSRMIHGPGARKTFHPSDIRLYQQNHMGAALKRAN